MQLTIHPAIPFYIDIKKIKCFISIFPHDFQLKYKNVKKEKGNSFNPSEHVKWWAYFYFEWIGLSFQFNIKKD